MAVMFTVNVYQINDNALLSTPSRQSFSPTNVKFRAAELLPNGSAANKSAAGTNLYGIVQELPRGLQTNSTNYYVVETVTQLAALANA